MNYMRYFILCFVMGVFWSSQGVCGEWGGINSTSRAERVYVQPHQILIEPNGIFVNISNQWFATESVSVDLEGIYVNNLAQEENVRLQWRCGKCGAINGPFDFRCQNCGSK